MWYEQKRNTISKQKIYVWKKNEIINYYNKIFANYQINKQVLIIKHNIEKKNNNNN